MLILDIGIMVIPEKLSSKKAEELREECYHRNIKCEGLDRDQMIVLISQYEGRLLEKEAETFPEVEEDVKADVNEIRKLEIQLKLQEIATKDREIQLNHEYRMRQLEIEQTKDSNVPGEKTSLVESKSLKMPYLKEDEDIETYLCTFERIAVTNKWSKDSWATRLAPLLTGKAREAYVRMDIDESGNYDLLRKAILARYDLTPENYRKQFRSCRKAPNETFVEWGIRATRLFKRWVGDSIKNPKELSELMIIEHILNNATPELQIWLREKEAKTVTELMRYAETYRSARHGTFSRYDSRAERSEHKGDRSRFEKQRNNQQNESKPTDNSANAKSDRSKFVTCFKCKNKGHYQSDCPENKKKATTGYCHSPTRLSSSFNKFTENGFVNAVPVQMILDSGSSCTLVHQKLVPKVSYTGKTFTVQFADGSERDVPIARLTFTGSETSMQQEVGVLESLPADVLVGHDTMSIFNKAKSSFAVTRSQAKMAAEKEKLVQDEIQETQVKVKPLFPSNNNLKDNDLEQSETCHKLQNLNEKPTSVISDCKDSSNVFSSDTDDASSNEDDDLEAYTLADENAGENEDLNSTLSLSKDQIMLLQQKDSTLTFIRDKARSKPLSDETSYFLHDGIIMRRYYSSKNNSFVDQLVVPRSCRRDLLVIAHSIPLSGHLGTDKTRNRLLAHYFWPNIYRDVQRFCATCPECQKTGRKLKHEKAALKPIPAVGVPFKKIGIDIVGPLPRSENGNRFILTIVDFSTRYPEAFAIPSQTAEVVADALMELFSRVGIPDEIISDQGTNFMSTLISQLCDTLGVRKINSTPYHPETNGLVERMNGTLKSMLRKFVHDAPKTWDKVLPYILFAYREVPEVSSGFSPFELIYGWPVRGPLSLVKDSWLDNQSDDISIVEHVINIRTKLAESTELAQQHLLESQSKMKTWYDQDARGQAYEEGEEVLVLLPTSSRSLEARWQGPFKIKRKLSDLNYEIDVGHSSKRLKIFHVNLLKRWRSRKELVLFVNSSDITEQACYSSENVESWKNVSVSDSLLPEQKQCIEDLLSKYSNVFSDQPSITNAAIHHIDTGDAKPIRLSPYRIPHSLRSKFQSEIEEMLRQGIIEKSTSDWAAPVVIVPKQQDGVTTGIRICVDLRRLNAVSNFDAHPLPRMEDLIEQLGDVFFISKLDLTKGYWQIPLSPETKDKSAFITPNGLYHFNVMPFGMKSAPATFQRMINKVLSGLELFSGAYLDDILIYSKTFEDHLLHLETVFQRLLDAKLVAKPSKCVLGHAQINYLGHLVGSGEMKPLKSKVECLQQFPIPETKKQLRSFIGLASYYRRYIPNFSSVAAPLTDKTGKKYSNKVKWTEDCDKAFQTLKDKLSSFPVLHLPNFSKPFVVQVDASERGLGAVLCQSSEDGSEHPIVYCSRKLLDREQKLSTTEKECLGIVWAVETFKPY